MLTNEIALPHTTTPDLPQSPLASNLATITDVSPTPVVGTCLCVSPRYLPVRMSLSVCVLTYTHRTCITCALPHSANGCARRAILHVPYLHVQNYSCDLHHNRNGLRIPPYPRRFVSSPTRTGVWESHSTQPARRGLHPIPHYVTVVHVRNGLKRTRARTLDSDHGYAYDRPSQR